MSDDEPDQPSEDPPEPEPEPAYPPLELDEFTESDVGERGDSLDDD